MDGKIEQVINSINDYFGTNDKETAIWFFCGLGFSIFCGLITLLVSVILP